jgi:hypothetical protein
MGILLKNFGSGLSSTFINIFRYLVPGVPVLNLNLLSILNNHTFEQLLVIYRLLYSVVKEIYDPQDQD